MTHVAPAAAARRNRFSLKSKLKLAVDTGSRSASGTTTSVVEQARHAVEPRDAVGRERRIAGEELVAPVAAECDRDVLAGEPREQVGREDRRVAERLVEQRRRPSAAVSSMTPAVKTSS